MKNIIILSVVLLLLAISGFLVSCDDFFSPVVEIFNEIKTPTNVEQDHKQEQKKEQKQENNSNQEIINQS